MGYTNGVVDDDAGVGPDSGEDDGKTNWLDHYGDPKKLPKNHPDYRPEKPKATQEEIFLAKQQKKVQTAFFDQKAKTKRWNEIYKFRW